MRKPRPNEIFKTPYLKKLEIDLNKMQQEAWLSKKEDQVRIWLRKTIRGSKYLRKQYLRISQYNKIEKKAFEC